MNALLKKHRIFIAYLAAFSAFTLLNVSAGTWVTDESSYFLMAYNLAEHGHFHILNGWDEAISPELVMPLTAVSSNGLEVRMYSQYPPLYGLFAYPFIKVFGPVGLNLMNGVFFIFAVCSFYLICTRFFGEKLSAIAAAAYSTSYALGYSQMVWPHSISAFLVTTSFLLFVDGIRGNHSHRLPMLFCGVFAGLAVGIRYPTGAFMLIEAAYLWFNKREGLRWYLLGLSLPFAVIGYLNSSFFGNPFETGYPQREFDRPFHYMVVLAVSSIIMYAGIRYRVVPDRIPYRLCVMCFVFILAVLATDAYFFTMEQEMVARIFNFWLFPKSPFFNKKAILQTVPYLILAAYGLRQMTNKKGVGMASLVTAYSLAEIAVMPVLPFSGWDESLGIRYFLDSLPFMIILSFYGMKRLVKKLGKDEKNIVYAAAVASSILFYAQSTHLYDRSGWTYHVPSILYIILLGLPLVKFDDFRRKAFIAALTVAVTYSAVAGVISFDAMKYAREITLDAQMQAVQHIGEKSVLFYPQASNIGFINFLSSERGTILINIQRDKGNDIERLINSFNKKGYEIWVCDCLNEAWMEHMEKVVNLYNITGVNTLTFNDVRDMKTEFDE